MIEANIANSANGVMNVYFPEKIIAQGLTKEEGLVLTIEKKNRLRFTPKAGSPNRGTRKSAKGVPNGRCFQYTKAPVVLPAFKATVLPVRAEGRSLVIDLPRSEKKPPAPRKSFEQIFNELGA